MGLYREGDMHEFIVGKQVVAPDNVKHFMLSGPDKRKFLLPAGQYHHYNIVPGHKLVCRIDKINCKGEIFLEPVNPWYSEGEIYSFEVTGVEMRSDQTGRKVRTVIVSDRSGNEIAVENSGRIPDPGSRIKLLVERISKGRLILRRAHAIGKKTELLPGKEYEFVVENISKGINNYDVYVVTDTFGKKHTIPKKYYESYGIKPGTKFTGKVVKYRSDGGMIIEPENPYYRMGALFEMKITGFSRNIDDDLYTLDVVDEFRHSHCIKVSVIPDGETIRCRVRMIRKGKPLLELL